MPHYEPCLLPQSQVHDYSLEFSPVQEANRGNRFVTNLSVNGQRPQRFDEQPSGFCFFA
jgi:hypothetical protein